MGIDFKASYKSCDAYESSIITNSRAARVTANDKLSAEDVLFLQSLGYRVLQRNTRKSNKKC